MAKKITIDTTINAPVERVWAYYTKPEHITEWNNASSDWHTPLAQNNLKVGGKFVYRMESKDGKEGFDFSGTYDEVKKNEAITYTMDDDRKVNVIFLNKAGKTGVKVTFEVENENSLKMQQGGWQAILDNFKKYAESFN